MRNRVIRLIVVGLFGFLAALGGAFLLNGNIAIQVGGANNKIDQTVQSSDEAGR